MATLYELTAQYMELLEMMLDPEIDSEVINDTMEMVADDLHDKANGYACIMAEINGRIDMIDVQIKRLQAMKKSLTANVDRLQSRLQETMVLTGERKFKTDLFSFSIAKNPPSVKVDDESQVPFEFWTTPEPTVNLKELKPWLKEHPECNWAHLEQTEGLRIK